MELAALCQNHFYRAANTCSSDLSLLFQLVRAVPIDSRQPSPTDHVSSPTNGYATMILFIERNFKLSNKKMNYYFKCCQPVDSIREAVLTVSPNRQYRGIVSPTTPAQQGPVQYVGRKSIPSPTFQFEPLPVCKPIRSCNGTSGKCFTLKFPL